MTAAFVSVAGRKWANLNGSHGGYRAHQALMETWKQLGVLAIRQARLSPVRPPVQITATVHRTTRAKADAHNVTPTIKATIDALVACGVIPEDHDGIVRRPIIQPGAVAAAPTVDLLVESV